MKLKITTLVIVEEGQVLDIFHSLKDNQEDAEHEIIDMVEEEYGDEDENIHFKSIQDIGLLRNRTYRDSKTYINQI